MIIYFFGQPCSGKTTLANYFYDNYYRGQNQKPFRIDGDKMRKLFSNQDYSREGRIKNLNKSADLAIYLNSEGCDVLMSLVCPFAEAREYLEKTEIPIIWVHLDYESIWDKRGREQNHIQDFDALEACPLTYSISINTTQLNIKDTYDEIVEYIHKVKEHLKENKTYTDSHIQIRYNTNFPKTSDKKWRLLVDGNQYLVDEIMVNVNTHTSTDFVCGDDGNLVEKHHITCFGRPEIKEIDEKTTAYIN